MTPLLRDALLRVMEMLQEQGDYSPYDMEYHEGNRPYNVLQAAIQALHVEPVALPPFEADYALHKQCRIAAGVSLRTLAKTMAFTPPYISDLEHGRRKWTPSLEKCYLSALEHCKTQVTTPPPPTPDELGCKWQYEPALSFKKRMSASRKRAKPKHQKRVRRGK